MKKKVLLLLALVLVLSALTACRQSFTVTFMAEDQIVKQITLNIGETLNPSDIPAVPQKEGYEGVWQEANWNDLTKDATINAVYTKIEEEPNDKIFTITFVNENDVIVQAFEVDEGADFDTNLIPAVPAKIVENQNWRGEWDLPTLTNIQADIAVEPKYTQFIVVTFVASGQTVKQVVLDVGETFATSEIPSVPKRFGYNGKWANLDWANLTSDTTVTAQYTKVEIVTQTLTITFVNEDGGIVQEFKVDKGDDFDTNLIPAVPPTSRQGNWIAEWDLPVLTNIQKAITISPKYTLDTSIATEGLNFELISAGERQGTYRLVSYTGTDTDVVISDTFGGIAVTEIAANVFRVGASYLNFSITSVVVGDNVEAIGASAFENTSELVTVHIGKSVATIGNRTFYGAKKVETLTFDKDIQLETIPNSFLQDGNSLLELTIPASVKKIGEHAFGGTWVLNNLTFAEGSVLQEIALRAFFCSYALGDVTFPDTLTTIGESAFMMSSAQDRGLTAAIFSANSQLTTIGDNAFRLTSLTTISIPKGVSVLPAFAFSECDKLQSVVFQEGCQIVEIGASAFEKCIALANFEIHSTVMTIGGSAFNGCKAIAQVTLSNPDVTVGMWAFAQWTNTQRIEIIGIKAPTANYNSAWKGSSTCIVIFYFYINIYDHDDMLLERIKQNINYKGYITLADINAYNIPHNEGETVKWYDNIERTGNALTFTYTIPANEANLYAKVVVEGDENAERVEQFKTTHATVLGLAVVTVATTDKTAVNNALAEFTGLTPEVKALLTDEKALLDDLLAKIVELEDEQTANTFKTTHSTVLALTVNSVEESHKDAIEAAIDEFTGLTTDVKALLADQKQLLDDLLAKIVELAAGQINEQLADTFRNENSQALAFEEINVLQSDKAVVRQAILALYNLDDAVQQLLQTENTLLHSLLKTIGNMEGELLVDFEDSKWASQTSYNNRTVDNGYKWSQSAVVATASANDHNQFTASKNARLRGSNAADQDNINRIELLTYIDSGIKSISFDYASYSNNHQNGVLIVSYMVRGSNTWMEIGTVTVNSFTDDGWKNYSMTLPAEAQNNSVRIKIAKKYEEGKSISVVIDNLSIEYNVLTDAQMAEKFQATYATVLALTVATVQLSDRNAVKTALEHFADLNTSIQTLLTSEKSKLDDLYGKIVELEDEQTANTFKTTHSTVLALTVDNVAESHKNAVKAALDEFNLLSEGAQALLVDEKQLLDGLLAKIIAESDYQIETYIVDFENGWDASAYATRPVQDDKYEWTVAGVVSASTADDHKDEYGKNIRFRGNTTADIGDATNRLELVTYFENGIESVTFDYSSYGGHKGGVIILYTMIEGSDEWVEAGSVTAGAWTTDGWKNATFDLNITDSVRIKIEKVSNAGSTSVNIDNIEIEYYA